MIKDLNKRLIYEDWGEKNAVCCMPHFDSSQEAKENKRTRSSELDGGHRAKSRAVVGLSALPRDVPRLHKSIGQLSLCI